MLAPVINNHIAAAQARFLAQFQNRPNIQAFMAALVAQIQELEDAIFALDAAQQLATAVGSQLDDCGALIDFPRPAGMSDPEYLLFLYGEIAAQYSDGGIEDVINIYANVLDAPWVQVIEYPSNCEIGLTAGYAIPEPPPQVEVWTAETTLFGAEDVCWSPQLGLFCAVSRAASTSCVMTSPDGRAWTAQTAPVAGNVADFNSVCWSPKLGLFCAVGSGGTVNQCLMTSPDGSHWTMQTAAVAGSTSEWWSVCWSPTAGGTGLFCAVALSGTAAQGVMTSPDGVIWTAQTAAVAGSAANWRSVSWSAGLSLFAAIGNGSGLTVSNTVMTSPDGVIWTSQAVPSGTGQFECLCWSPTAGGTGLFCAIGQKSGTTDCLITSPDGINWTAQTVAISGSVAVWYSICWSEYNSCFVAIGIRGTTAQCLMTSPDGINWTAQISPIAGSTAEWLSVCSADSIGIICALGVSGNYAMISRAPQTFPYAATVLAMVQQAAGAGVKIKYVAVADPIMAFACYGGTAPALGFGDATNPQTDTDGCATVIAQDGVAVTF